MTWRVCALFFAAFLCVPTGPCAAAASWPEEPLGARFGVQVKEGRATDQELAMIRAAGLSYVRFVIPWYEVEKEKGRFDWALFDPFVERLRKHGLKAVVVLGGGHPAYTGTMPAPKGNIDQAKTYVLAPETDAAVHAFAFYAARTVQHFGEQDIVWELWNEPDSDRFWAPRADAQAYARLARESCRAIKRAKPKARVIGPGMADMPRAWGRWRADFLGAVLRADGESCLDAVSVHPYRDGEKPPETVLAAYGRLNAFVAQQRKGGALPFAATEWGFSLTDTTPEEQADFLLRSFLLNALAGARVSIWYEWRDAREGADDPEAHFGLLTLSGEPKPAYRALLEFLPSLANARIEGRLGAEREDDFILKLKHPEGTYSLVLWSARPESARPVFLHGCSLASTGRKWRLTSRPVRVDCKDAAPLEAPDRETP